jgi:hypothetical protein
MPAATYGLPEAAFLGVTPQSDGRENNAIPVAEAFATLLEAIERSGADSTKPYYYLAGPMTGIPYMNFPRFGEVAARLRKEGYNVVSPAELGNPEMIEAAMASVDGEVGSGDVGGGAYTDFLGYDLVICSLPLCIGGIFLDGWHHSLGARGESWVLQFLKKEMYEYAEKDGELALNKLVHRDQRMAELGVSPEGVPKDAPGVKTAASNGHKP